MPDTDIYAVILNHSGCWLPVAKRDSAGTFSPPDAALGIVEQDRQSTDGTLFPRIQPEALQPPTVAALIPLLSHYVVWEGHEDVGLDNTTHAAAVEHFLDAIMDTWPMQQAEAYLHAAAPTQFPNATAVRNWTRQVWFEPFTNEYAAQEHWCSGFEHVFVGEVQQGAVSGDNRMDIGGYHSWIKYVLDQQAGLVRYLGHDYTASAAAAGKANPREASVIMTWVVDGVEYLKNPGGFFCADLPEMQIALGILGVFDSLRGTFGGSGQSGKITDRKVAFGTEFIDLVIYPQTVNNGGTRRPGDHLRSMYPKFRGMGATPQPGADPALPHTPHNGGPLRIAAALPNPEGTDDTGEWVEIFNATAHAVTLAMWSLKDAQFRSLSLTGTLAPQEVLRVSLDRTSPNSVQLSNNGGWIMLFEGDQRVAAVRYNSAPSGVVLEFS